MPDSVAKGPLHHRAQSLRAAGAAIENYVGTISSSDELTGDFDSRLKITSIGDGCLFRLLAGD